MQTAIQYPPESPKDRALASLQQVSSDLETTIDLFGDDFTAEQLAFGIFFDERTTLLFVYRTSRMAVPAVSAIMADHLTECIDWATGFDPDRFILDDGSPVEAWRVFLAYLNDGCLVGATEPIAPTLRSRLRIPA